MPGPTVDIGRELVGFIDPQTAFKTPAGLFPVAADALRLIGANCGGRPMLSFFEDKRGTSTKVGKIDEKEEANLSLDFYAYVTTAGTAPDWWDILLYGGFQETTGVSTTVSGSGSTVSRVDVTSSAGFTVGGCVEISGEVRRITAIDSVGTDIDVTPDLSTAPADTTAVTAGLSAKPDDSRADTPDAMTVWIGNNRSLERFVGWSPDSFSLQNPGTGAAKWSISGPARERRVLYSTTLNDAGGIDAVVTSITVTSGTACPSDVSATNPYFFEIGTEVIKVIAVSGTTWTLDTRGARAHGGANASHNDGVEIFPAVPTGTYAGSPVPATSGDIIFDAVDLSMDSANLDCGMAIIPQEDEFGDAKKMAGYVCDMRSIKPSAEGSSYYDTTMARMQDAFDRASVQLFAQRGDTSGAIVAWECPTCRIEQADLDRGADEVQVTLTGEAEGTEEDEVYIMVA